MNMHGFSFYTLVTSIHCSHIQLTGVNKDVSQFNGHFQHFLRLTRLAQQVSKEHQSPMTNQFLTDFL